jgi:leucyl/phenylalanyl-tRNA--protein transferase
MLYLLEGTAPGTRFPDPNTAEEEPNGLLAVGGDLSPQRLLNAYRQGLFPWYSEGQPILWWSPDPRMVLFPSEVHVSRSLRKTLRQGRFQVSVDRAFEAVIQACAEPRPDSTGTWLVSEMIDAYRDLHRLGHAHSVETWLDDELVGGLYGVALGRTFFGESMFSLATDASKVALVMLAEHCQRAGIELIDCQVYSDHLRSLGAREIPRREFLARVTAAVDQTTAESIWPRPIDRIERQHRSDPADAR